MPLIHPTASIALCGDTKMNDPTTGARTTTTASVATSTTEDDLDQRPPPPPTSYQQRYYAQVDDLVADADANGGDGDGDVTESARPRRKVRRKKQVSFGLPFEGPRRLRQVSFGLGLSFGDDDGTDKSPSGNVGVVPQGDEEFADNEEPPSVSDHDDDHCKDRRWGRGIVADFRRTVGTHWIKEMTNLNQTVIATTFFLFFACIAPAITFGT